MNINVRNRLNFPVRKVAALAVSLALGLGLTTTASADEEDAKRLLKAMSDYLAATQTYSFDFDATLEVITAEDQVLGVASSGSANVARPNKIHATRAGGFADVDMMFDGTTFTILGKNMNAYTQVEIPGTLDNLIDVLRDQYGRPLPAADLLTSDSYDTLIKDVTDIKDLGSGVVGGMECDSLAFRNDQVDFQIWIAHGDQPYPCRLVITSKTIAGGPQYSIQVSNWKTGDDVSAGTFTFTNTTDASKVALDDLDGAADLPGNFIQQGEAQ